MPLECGGSASLWLNPNVNNVCLEWYAELENALPLAWGLDTYWRLYADVLVYRYTRTFFWHLSSTLCSYDTRNARQETKYFHGTLRRRRLKIFYGYIAEAQLSTFPGFGIYSILWVLLSHFLTSNRHLYFGNIFLQVVEPVEYKPSKLCDLAVFVSAMCTKDQEYIYRQKTSAQDLATPVAKSAQRPRYNKSYPFSKTKFGYRRYRARKTWFARVADRRATSAESSTCLYCIFL